MGEEAMLREETDVCIRVRGVEKRFGEHTALHGVSFDVRRGEIFALLGTNGAGKTTIANLLLDRFAPDSGEILRVADAKLSRNMVYFPTELHLLGNLPLRKVLIHTAMKVGIPEISAVKRAEEWLCRIGLQAAADFPVRRLSRGNQHRVLFAVAAIENPSILFLDEPCLGLDPINQALFAALVRQLRDAGTTILLSDHNLDWVQRLADRYCILHEGRVREGGTLPEMRRRAAIGVCIYVSLWDGSEKSVPELQDQLAHLKIHSVESIRPQAFRIVLHDTVVVDSVLRFLRASRETREVAVEEPSLHDIYLHTLGLPSVAERTDL